MLGGGLSFLSQGQAAPDSHEKEGRAFSQSRALHGREEGSHSQSVPSTGEGLQGLTAGQPEIVSGFLSLLSVRLVAANKKGRFFLHATQSGSNL